MAEGARTEMVVWITFGRAETHEGARGGAVKRASIICIESASGTLVNPFDPNYRLLANSGY